MALWASGNDIVIFWEDFENRSSYVSGTNASRQATSYDEANYSPGSAPILHLEWTEAGWAGEFCGVAVAEFDGVTPAEIDGV